MNKRNIYIVIALFAIIVTVVVSTGCRKGQQNLSRHETMKGEITQNVKTTETSSNEEEVNQVTITESSPDSVILDVKTEDGNKITVEIGGTTENVFPDEPENEDTYEELLETRPTTPQETQPEATSPTAPQETQPEATSPTAPQETQPETTPPTSPEIETPSIDPPQTNIPVGPNTSTTLAEYEAMSAQEQLLFY